MRKKEREGEREIEREKERERERKRESAFYAILRNSSFRPRSHH
jgi:hypothetical protein